MFTRLLLALVTICLLSGLGGCRKAETPYVSSDEWRGVLRQALHGNPPGSPHFVETTWRWSAQLFQQAAASKRDGPHRVEDRKALMEWAVLACYLDVYDKDYERPSVFAQNDKELMASAMKHAVETFGQPAMGKSWNSFAAVWKEYRLKSVENPFN